MNSRRLFSFMAISATTVALLSGSTNLFGVDGYEVLNKGTVNEYIRLKAHRGIKPELKGCGTVEFTLKNPDDASTLPGIDANGNSYEVPKFMLVAELWDYPSPIPTPFGEISTGDPHQVHYTGRAGLGSGSMKFGFDNADYHISLYEITEKTQSGDIGRGGFRVTLWSPIKRPLTNYVDIKYHDDVKCSDAPAKSLGMKQTEKKEAFPGNPLGDFQKYPIASY
ncbi:hypothetical protein KJZ61_04205 [Candidatus Dependentiae bacterium]|nr:hypothetical protein [Candidatus Dependentiae bacterium]